MIISANQKVQKRYAPIPIGNGDLSLMIDHTGSNNCTDPVYSLHRAGIRRQATNALLFPFGRITQRYCGSAEEMRFCTLTAAVSPSISGRKTISR